MTRSNLSERFRSPAFLEKAGDLNAEAIAPFALT